MGIDKLKKENEALKELIVNIYFYIQAKVNN